MLLKAEQIMTKDVVVVKTKTSLKEVMRILSEHPFSGLPVVDEGGQLLGIVSEYDLLLHKSPLHYPRFINILGGIIHVDDLSAFNEQLKKSLALQVDEVMTPSPITVDPETPVQELAQIMVQKKVNRLPVVKEGHLLGIVTRADIVSAMGEGENDAGYNGE